MRRGLAIAAAAAALAAAAPSAQAATVLTAGPDDHCAKGGCFGDDHTYTRSWSGAALSGPVTITSLKLFKSLLGDMQNRVVKIQFETADGTVLSNWGGYLFSVLGGDVVDLGGEAFEWNPAMGNLVLKLEAMIPGQFGGGGFGGGGFGGGGLGAPLEFGGSNGGTPSLTVAARGDVSSAASLGDGPLLSAAPEPSTWLLSIGGFLAIGALARRRRLKLA
jgi:hypothetical protein